EGEGGGGGGGGGAGSGNAEEVRDLAGQPVDRTLERESLPLPYPLAEQVGRVASVAELVDVGTAVGEPDQEPRIRDHGPNRFRILVQQRKVEQRLELVLERHIEHGIGRIDTAQGRDLGDRFADHFGKGG